jgi:hypothetical protein
MHRAAMMIAAALGLATFGAAHATVVTYPDFTDTSGLTMKGDTAAVGSVLRIVPALGSQSGAAYSTTPITLGTNATFSTQFQFRFTNPGGWDPADGITFVLAASPDALGSGGVGLGYGGVPDSFAVEFDTYNNGSADDNSSNHIAIDADGLLGTTAQANVYGNGSCGFPSGGFPVQDDYAVDGCMANGHAWTALITYDGATSLLNVTVTDPDEPGAFHAISDYSIDISGFLGTNTAYVGFTGGTGAGWENEDILDWTFANTATLPAPPPTGVPEPGSLGMLGLGLLGLGMGAWARRRHAAASGV